MLSAHYGAVQSTGLGRLENTEVLPLISFLTFPFGETEERLYEQEPGEPQGFAWLSFGATDVTRTHDLLITNQLLYRLSYSSI